MSLLRKARVANQLVLDTLRTCIPAALATKRKSIILPAGSEKSAIQVRVSDRVTGLISKRFLSFTVDIAQVVGGKFWDQGGGVDMVPGGSSTVIVYDFGRPRLKKLVQELSPAYLRIGGTASDEVFYDLGDSPGSPPAPYKYTFTWDQWNSVNQFAQETGSEVVFTLNAGQGPRDRNGRWRTDQAYHLIVDCVENCFPVTAWSMGNEPNLFPFAHDLWLTMGQYAQEYAELKALLKEIMPGARLLGPSSAFWPVIGEMLPILPRFLEQAGRWLDVVTWHYYPQQSRRSPIAVRRASADWMLEPAFLDETTRWAASVEHLRQQYAPQAEVWLEETGNAQCGGEPRLSERFIAGFWWLDLLGSLARRGQQVVARQNLSGADYSLIRDSDLDPNPDYWNSLLWNRLMGEIVYGVELSEPRPDLRVYAHCTRDGAPGSIAVLAMNINRQESQLLDFGISPLDIYLCTADDLLGREVLFNGRVLAARPDGSVPEFEPVIVTNGLVRLPPVSYAFVIMPG